MVGMVCRTTNGAGTSLLELFAQLHDILALAQSECHIEALADICCHIPSLLQFGNCVGQLVLFGRATTDFCLLLTDLFIACSNAAPQRSSSLKPYESVFIVGESALYIFTIYTIVGTLMDTQFGA